MKTHRKSANSSKFSSVEVKRRKARMISYCIALSGKNETKPAKYFCLKNDQVRKFNFLYPLLNSFHIYYTVIFFTFFRI